MRAITSEHVGPETPAASTDALVGPLLRASAIKKRYGERLVLDRVSLAVDAGEAIALVGENGAGKTTLLRICAGLIATDDGRVSISGSTGYCPQEPGLLDLLTVDEHLRLFGAGLGLAPADSISSGHRLLAELGLTRDLDVPVRRLSGGSRQKLNLALALLGEPDMLLLDEPYQGFDHGTYVSFWEHVDRWRSQGRAIVVVTHLLADTVPIDRVVELRVAR
jgi:ABC-2 type transport system ATP-binding protein